MTELICIVCPRGCHLSVDKELNVTGNGCLRGKEYGINEVTNPTRMVTSTIAVTDAETLVRLPVKTSRPVPRGKIFEVMKEINRILVQLVPAHSDNELSGFSDLQKQGESSGTCCGTADRKPSSGKNADNVILLKRTAPIHAGDILIPDILGLGADLVATRTVEK